MNLKTRISEDAITAMRNRDTIAKNLLNTIKGEIQLTEKNIGEAELSDESTLKILTKMCKSLDEIIKETGDTVAENELLILRTYMPREMSREDIRTKIENIKNSNDSMNIGMVMKAFSSDVVDRKLVAEIFNEIV